MAKRLLQAFVISILLGILGMHALSLPGLSPEGTHADHSQQFDQAVAGAALGVEPSQDPPATESGGGARTLVVLCCGAMLGVALGVAWLLARRRSQTVADPRPLRMLQQVGLGHTTRHGQGPPYVWTFSVIRC